MKLRNYVEFDLWACLIAGTLLGSSCATTPQGTASTQQELSAGEVTCTATTQCTCSVISPDSPGTSEPDAGPSPDGGTTPTPDAGGLAPNWSYTTSGNRILSPDGGVFLGRGAGVFDTNGCGACTGRDTWPEVQRRASFVAGLGANLIRLALENPSTAGDAYFTGLLNTVNYMKTNHPSVLLLVAGWLDPTFTPDSKGGPTAASVQFWIRLTDLLRDHDNVAFGIANEPRGQPDTTVAANYQLVIDAIRATENPDKRHLITVQGTQGWARYADYWVRNPPGPNIAVEIHIYDPVTEFPRLLGPAASIPLVIGEFGAGSQMDMAAAQALTKEAERRNIPWIGWSFASRCAPNLLASTVPMCTSGTLTLSNWGQYVASRLALPWGAP